MSFTLSSLAIVLVAALHVLAESHTVHFQNKCGSGTPKLIQGANTLSTGEDYTSNGALESSIAYLDRDGECDFNGENCTLVELNLNNPTCAGCGSSADISLIPTHVFNVEASFAYFGGDGNVCDGLGAVCADANCSTAFFVPDDTSVQRACQADNVNLLITFCGGGSTGNTDAVVGSLLALTESLGSGSSSDSGSGSSSSASASTSVAAATTSSSSSSGASASPTTSSTGSDTSQTDTVNVATSSPVPSSSSSASSSASSSTPTCSRKRSKRRSKRSSTLSHHARSRRRAQAFAGIRDSNF